MIVKSRPNRKPANRHRFANLGLPMMFLASQACLAIAGSPDRGAVAAALGVIRKGSSDIGYVDGGNIVSIDFDVPRYGTLCISVDSSDDVEFVWEEYHNLHQLPDEDSFRNCDFSKAVALAPEGRPMPLGYKIEATTAESARYFSCSKICASNSHKVKVCAGGDFGEDNECQSTDECASNRTIDLRTMTMFSPSLVEQSRDGYVPVGKVCRPKNGDGYSITSGTDTPESCRKKCDEDSERCGAWEFEDYAADDKECELHEIDIISYEKTRAMGECLTNTTGTSEGYYRCCWISREILEAQIGLSLRDDKVETTSIGFMCGAKNVAVFATTTVLALIMSCI